MACDTLTSPRTRPHRQHSHRRRARQTGPLLGVWAHPDDETYMSAGLMAAARRRGRRVVVLTMTAGERGTQDPDRWPPERLGALRRHELRASLAAIGVREHHVVGLPDGGCDQFDATSMIEAAIRAVKPSTVVTFGRDGFTGHADHRAVSRWTTAAWEAAGQPGDLWYATVTPSFHTKHGHLNDAVDLWSMGETEPPCDPHEELAHEVHLTGHDLDQKIAALRAHASQTDSMIKAVGEDAYRDWWSKEFFIAAPRRANASDDAGRERQGWVGGRVRESAQHS